MANGSSANTTLLNFFNSWLTDVNDAELVLSNDELIDFNMQLAWRRQMKNCEENEEEEARLKCECIAARIREKLNHDDFEKRDTFRYRCFTLPSGGHNSQVTPEVIQNRRLRRDSVQEHSAPVLTTINSIDEEKASDKSTPKWRCFIKQTDSSQLLLTFVPASVKELLKLSKEDAAANTDVKNNANSTAQNRRRQDSLDMEDDTRKLVDNKEKKTNDEHSRIDDGQDHFGNQKQANEGTQNSDRIRMSIFVYVCSLSMLNEQIVNRWTYCRSDDIVQDFTDISEEILGSESGTDETRSNERRRQLSGSLSTSPRAVQRSKTISECLMEFKSKASEFDSDFCDDVTTRHQRELKEYCSFVSENFFRSSVKGMHYLISCCH